MPTTPEIRVLSHHQTGLELYYSYPENTQGRLPAVLIFSPWTGRTSFAETKAQSLAEKGYVGIAVDLYGEGRTGSSKEECSRLMTPFIQDRQFLRDRMAAILAHLQQDERINSSKIVAIGYCFGGLCVLDAVRNNLGLCAGVSIHGLYGRPDYQLPKTYTSKVLTLHGFKDPMISQAEVRLLQEELQNAAVDWQMITYGQGYHAFTTPGANDPDFGTVFDACLDERTTLYVDAFLKEVLG